MLEFSYFDIYPSFKIPFSPKIIMFYMIACAIKKKAMTFVKT